MSYVYAVQKPMNWDRDRQKMVDRFDFTTANMYGEIIYLLSPTAAPFAPDSIILELEEKLKDFNEYDYLLLVGNPCLIGICHTIATLSMNRNMQDSQADRLPNCLQWSGKNKEYIQVMGGCHSF